MLSVLNTPMFANGTAQRFRAWRVVAHIPSRFPVLRFIRRSASRHDNQRAKVFPNPTLRGVWRDFDRIVGPTLGAAMGSLPGLVHVVL